MVEKTSGAAQYRRQIAGFFFLALFTTVSAFAGAPSQESTVPVTLVSTEPQVVTMDDGSRVEVRVQVLSGSSTSEAELEAANRLVQQAIDSSRKLSPEAPFFRVVVDAPGGDHSYDYVEAPLSVSLPITARAEIPQTLYQDLKQKFWGWFSKPKVYRRSFALTQLLMGGVATYYTLVETAHATPSQALTMGVLMGGIAAGFMHQNQNWYKMLFDRSLVKKLFGLKKQHSTDIALHTEALVKSYIANALASIVTLAGMAAVGLNPYASAGAVATSFLLTTVLDVASEFPWEGTIAVLTKNASAQQPHKSQCHDFYNDLTNCALGTVGAAMTLAQLMQMPLAREITVGIAAAGGLTYAVVLKMVPGREITDSCTREIVGASNPAESLR